MTSSSEEAAARLYQRLKQNAEQIVFAESCTAGLIAATLGRFPGISEWLVGSAVVYQVATKSEWLDVDEEAVHASGVVSRVVAEQMAVGALRRTPHATIAASVTGHLGPNAPPDQDGIAWTAIARDRDGEISLAARRLELDDLQPDGRVASEELRIRRQHAAASLVMEFCCDVLQDQ